MENKDELNETQEITNGEEDFEVAKRRNMKIFNPIDEKLNFTEDFFYK